MGGKYDSLAFKKSVGLNGVGTKAVNALSNYFRESVQDEKQKAAEFSAGNLVLEEEDILIPQRKKRNQSNFIPDEAILKLQIPF
jgi:topoisomerase-4 subunit B